MNEHTHFQYYITVSSLQDSRVIYEDLLKPNRVSIAEKAI